MHGRERKKVLKFETRDLFKIVMTTENYYHYYRLRYQFEQNYPLHFLHTRFNHLIIRWKEKKINFTKST